jgi:hypothetical protein
MQDPSNPGVPAVTPASAPVPGALCAKHPSLAAYAVCSRCGNYMCPQCSDQGRSTQCEDCRARTGGGSATFPFTRDNYTVEKLIEHSWRVWKDNWQTLTIAAIVFLGITYGVAFVFGMVAALITGLTSQGGTPQTGAIIGIQVSGQIAQMVLQVWLQLGMFAITFDVLEGKRPGINVLFSRASRIGTGFAQLLLMYLAMALLIAPLGAAFFLDDSVRWQVAGGGLLVLLFPLCWVGLGFAFSMLDLAYDPNATATSSIRKSFALVSGQRWRVVLMGLVAGVAVVAGVIACCIGVLPAMSLATTLFCSMYLALRNGSGVGNA